jgi:spatacsin
MSVIKIHCYFEMCFVLHVEYKSYSPEALWRYLTARHDWLNITLWIGEFQMQESYVSLQQNKWPPLTVDVIDQNTCCNNCMRNEILDKLARYCNC